MTRRLPSLQAFTQPRKTLLSVAISLMIAGPACAQQPWIATAVDGDEGPVVLQGEQLSGRPDREVQLERAVEITRGSTVVNADTVHYDIVDDRVDAEGDVRVVREGNRFNGAKLKLKLDTGVGFMDSPVYRLLRKNAQGYAERIDFESESIATVQRGIYTTCEGPAPDWYLKTSKLTLDDETGVGYAKSAVLMFKGVPVGGAPQISFPITDERMSGFLAPSIATSSSSGLQVTTPYYWNIAPNHDVTFYPRYIAKRGLMLGADVRYLEEAYAGETRFEFINDDQRAGATRYNFSSKHNQALAPGLTLSTDLNLASDDDYAKDFPASHVWNRLGVTRRLLPQSLTVAYGTYDWEASFLLHQFQVLQDPLKKIDPLPYSRLPQITVSNFNYDDRHWEFVMNSQFTSFVHPTLEQGDRIILNPRVSYNVFQDPGYFVRPSFSVHSTAYNLEHVTDPLMTAPTRVLPTFSLDSGMVFERDIGMFGRDAIQTVEPRVFYTRTPFKAQNSNLYPNFDTSEADISYAQIFKENRFVGDDRIGDSNQVTLALTSRFLETNGAERLRTAIAQRYNISEPRVGLGSEQQATEAKSDILLLTSGRISREMRVDANFQYNQVKSEVDRMNVGVFWTPEPMKVLNVQYRRDTRNLPNILNTNFELIDVSGQWPLGGGWYGVGRLNYLLDEKRVGQSLAGLEYQADCWIFRAVGQRLPTATGVVNTSLFFQIEFNGLSSLGINPMRVLRTNIPGYERLAQPQ
ncbi:MAG: hypothetical protein RL404_873 [Pseudomonadota bacterium]